MSSSEKGGTPWRISQTASQKAAYERVMKKHSELVRITGEKASAMGMSIRQYRHYKEDEAHKKAIALGLTKKKEPVVIDAKAEAAAKAAYAIVMKKHSEAVRITGEKAHALGMSIRQYRNASPAEIKAARLKMAKGKLESDAPKRPRKGRGADAYVAEGVAGMVVGDSKVLRDYVDKKTKDAEDAGDDSGTIRMSGLDAAKLLQQLGWSGISPAMKKTLDEHKF